MRGCTQGGADSDPPMPGKREELSVVGCQLSVIAEESQGAARKRYRQQTTDNGQLSRVTADLSAVVRDGKRKSCRLSVVGCLWKRVLKRGAQAGRTTDH